MTDRIILTPAEAVSLLHDGETVHNMRAGGGLSIGADWSREEAVQAFEAAESIEIAGPNAKAMRHPLYVVQENGRASFFEADLAKVEAFEAARSPVETQ